MTEFLTRQVSALAQTQLQFSTDGPQFKCRTSLWHTHQSSSKYYLFFIALYLVCFIRVHIILCI